MSKEQTSRKTEIQLASERIRVKNAALELAKNELELAQRKRTAAATEYNKAHADAEAAAVHAEAAQMALAIELERLRAMTTDLIAKVNG